MCKGGGGVEEGKSRREENPLLFKLGRVAFVKYFHIQVTIELKRHGQRLDRVDSSSFFSDGSSSVFPVYFAQPIQIEPETWYTASAILDGTELSYFGQEGMPEVQCGRVTFQFQCSTESTNGTGVQGGQIPEILFFG